MSERRQGPASGDLVSTFVAGDPTRQGIGIGGSNGQSVVAAGAPHRGDAFAAARYTLDTLKVQVPIWKKEVTTDGEYWVEDHP